MVIRTLQMNAKCVSEILSTVSKYFVIIKGKIVT